MAGDTETEIEPLRIMFDENMSGDVAKALGLLGKDVIRTKPARPGHPGRKDTEVARDAKRQGRLVFTNNFDMVVAAVQEDARVIWFYDKKHNSPTKYVTARLFFFRWEFWEQRLSTPDAYCMRVSMDRSQLISKEAAHKQASRLDRRSKRKKVEAAVRSTHPRLSFDD